jgi:glycosyltransferase involved in cell wall biosynthesis
VSIDTVAPARVQATACGAAPGVAVIMAAYNSERTIGQAVDSLLRSTHPCRIVIVDDASIIPVKAVLGAADSERVDIIRLEHNVGPAAARNIALQHVLRDGYAYVAILDADDASHPERIARQVGYLEANPEVALVGCWLRLIDDGGALIGHYRGPCEPHAIRKRLPIRMCIPHPSWLMRTDVFSAVGVYAPEYRAAEDYDLLLRIAALFNVASVPEFLLDYRLSSAGITARARSRELVNRIRIQLRYFRLADWRAWAGVLRTLALLALRPLASAWTGAAHGLRS